MIITFGSIYIIKFYRPYKVLVSPVLSCAPGTFSCLIFLQNFIYCIISRANIRPNHLVLSTSMVASKSCGTSVPSLLISTPPSE